MPEAVAKRERLGNELESNVFVKTIDQGRREETRITRQRPHRQARMGDVEHCIVEGN